MSAVEDLNTDIGKAYDSLRNLEDSINALSGRGGSFGGGGRVFSDGGTRDDFYGQQRREPSQMVTVTGAFGAAKRHVVVSSDSNVFERLNKRMRIEPPDEVVPIRRTVQSSIVMPLIETKSREAAIKELNETETKEDVVRNRRLFSKLLMGTLERFSKDERKQKRSAAEKLQAEKQKEVERRLKESAAEEKERVAKERLELLEKKREQEMLIRNLQRKKAVIQYAEREIAHYEKLRNFIQTKTRPPIFWLPAKHTFRTMELLKMSAKKIDGLIDFRRKQMEEDLKSPDERGKNPGDTERRESEDNEADGVWQRVAVVSSKVVSVNNDGNHKNVKNDGSEQIEGDSGESVKGKVKTKDAKMEHESGDEDSKGPEDDDDDQASAKNSSESDGEDRDERGGGSSDDDS